MRNKQRNGQQNKRQNFREFSLANSVKYTSVARHDKLKKCNTINQKRPLEEFNVSVINPIITNNSTNLNIRKVHNDKFDSKKLDLIALKPDLKTSVIPSDLVLNIRNLVREYYRLKDERTAYVIKLTAILKVSFPD